MTQYLLIYRLEDHSEFKILLTEHQNLEELKEKFKPILKNAKDIIIATPLETNLTSKIHHLLIDLTKKYKSVALANNIYKVGLE
jgi:CRISPR/Cas system-associated endoribonuclease Cas2